MSERGSRLVICSTSYHETDRRIMRISDALLEQGYTITWLSRSMCPQENTSERHRFKHQIVNALFKRGPLFYVEYNIRLFILLLFTSAEIVCAVDLDTVPGVSVAGFIKRYKVVYDAHEIFYEVPELIGKPLKKKIWQSVARFFLPKIKHNYTVNKSLARHYSEGYGTDYTVIRNIASLNVDALQEQPFRKVIVYLGVLNTGRGVELAIEVMKEKQDYQLLLMGEGDLSDELRALARGMHNVEFLGHVNPSEVNKTLRKADIGLNVLVAESLNYKLSLANKFFDYLHAGLPSINMQYPEYQNILSDHKVGIMIDKYSSEQLSRAIDKISNPELYAELKANCLASRHMFTWENEKKKLIHFYDNLKDNTV